MASLSTCHLGLWLEWQILLNLVKMWLKDVLTSAHIHVRTHARTPDVKNVASVGLVDDRTADIHALEMARFALDLMDGVKQLSRDSFPARNISLRIAVNTSKKQKCAEGFQAYLSQNKLISTLN